MPDFQFFYNYIISSKNFQDVSIKTIPIKSTPMKNSPQSADCFSDRCNINPDTRSYRCICGGEGNVSEQAKGARRARVWGKRVRTSGSGCNLCLPVPAALHPWDTPPRRRYTPCSSRLARILHRYGCAMRAQSRRKNAWAYWGA